MLEMQNCGTSAKDNGAHGEEQAKAEALCATGSRAGAVKISKPLEQRLFKILDARHGTVGFVVSTSGFYHVVV